MSGIVLKKSNPFLGTFHFCDGCLANKNCCTGKTVDKAILTPKDIRIISKKTGLHRSEFSTPTNGSLASMKVRGSECYFYQNRKCTIYNVRPVDCRLFPFDIRKNNKLESMLVWYSTACPKQINAESYEKSVKLLLNSLHPYSEEFAKLYSPLLDKHDYKIVGTIRK